MKSNPFIFQIITFSISLILLGIACFTPWLRKTKSVRLSSEDTVPTDYVYQIGLWKTKRVLGPSIPEFNNPNTDQVIWDKTALVTAKIALITSLILLIVIICLNIFKSQSTALKTWIYVFTVISFIVLLVSIQNTNGDINISEKSKTDDDFSISSQCTNSTTGVTLWCLSFLLLAVGIFRN